MAINEVYGIYDEATEAYVQFIPCINEKNARMTIEKLFKDKRLNIPMIYDYPNNFKVCKLGIFDDNTGLFDNAPQQTLLVEIGSLSSSDTVNP